MHRTNKAPKFFLTDHFFLNGPFFLMGQLFLKMIIFLCLSFFIFYFLWANIFFSYIYIIDGAIKKIPTINSTYLSSFLQAVGCSYIFFNFRFAATLIHRLPVAGHRHRSPSIHFSSASFNTGTILSRRWVDICEIMN